MIGVFPSGSVVMEILIDETLGWNVILISDQNSEIEVGSSGLARSKLIPFTIEDK